MSIKVLTEQQVRELIGKLMEQAKVVAPHEREVPGQYSFMEASDPAKVVLKYNTTVLPPKKMAYPPIHDIVRFRMKDSGFEAEPVVEAEDLVLFAVHPCDIYALECLDISMTEQYADPHWVERRKRMRIVGIDCEPDEWCFCAAMGTATASSGYDLFLTPIKGWSEFVAETGSEAGEEMLKLVEGRDATSEDMAEVRRFQSEKVRKQAGRSINTELVQLPLHFTGFAESTVWQKYAEKCYSCGTCNTTCPTCFCFDVADEMELNLKEGRRVRLWDGCLLEEFAMVAPHENFRPERWQRLRHRFYRKYAYLFTRYGRVYCCGCGRCVRQCLADIDPVEVLNDLLAEGAKEASIHGS